MSSVGRPEADSFSAFLCEALAERARSNPRYSLRAFARLVDVDASLLSKIMRGKASVTRRLFEKVSDRLQIPPYQAETLARGLGFATATNGSSSSRTDYEQLDLKEFHWISDWYHYALFALLDVPGFKPSAPAIARALKISSAEASLALQRLRRLGVLEQDRTGKWKRTKSAITTIGEKITTPDLRRMQKQWLDKAAEAMEAVPLDRRDQSSLTIAVDTRTLAKAKEKIGRFRRELAELVQSSGDLDQVYQLNVSFFPLTELPKKKGTARRKHP